MAEAASPSDGPLTVAEATGLLIAEPDEQAAAAPETDETETELVAEPTAEDALDPDDEPAIEGDDEAQPGDPDAPVIAAPQSWAADERALFATLPPEAQRVIAARESERDQAVNRSQTEAAEARKKAEQEVQSVTQIRAATEQVLTRVGEIFHGKWDNVDWQAWAAQDPAAYVAGKAQFDAENAELARLKDAHQQQQAVELRAFQARKVEQIKTLAPELVDPVKGRERVQNLERFLQSEVGVDRSVFHTLDANVIALAYDGFRYRQAKKAAATPPPANKQAAVRPTATQAVRAPQRAAQEANARFQKTPSIDNAVAALLSRT